MRFLFYSTTFAISLVCFAHAVTPEEKAVADFLNTQTTIRVGISQAPGNGHQSASVILIKRLREIGYTGKIEAIYSEAKDGREKLGFLLPGFNPKGPDVQHLDNLNLDLITATEFLRSNPKPVPIGMSGALDAVADFDLETTHYLQLQPYTWGADHFVLYRKEDGRLERVNLNHLRSQGVRMQTSVGPPATQLTENLPGVRALLENPSRFDWMPIYGRSDQPYKVAMQAVAAQAAQAHKPAAFRGPVIVPVFSKFTSADEADIRQLATQWAKEPSKLKFCRADDPSLSAIRSSLKAGETLIVFIGNVPPEVFNHFLDLSTLPASVAGKNAMNYMLNVGKPFQITSQDKTHIQAVAEAAKSLSPSEQEGVVTQLRTVHSALDLDLVPMAPDLKALTDYYLSALDPADPMHAAFRMTGETHRQNDKLSAGLLRFKELIEPSVTRAKLEGHCVTTVVSEAVRNYLMPL
ncbi:MAG: hypothetical protein AB7P04_03835 [Bacteriovoracia bacterium]